MHKKISLPTLLFSIVVAALMTFMLTYVLLDSRMAKEIKELDTGYREQLLEYQQQYGKYEKLYQLDTLFRNNYIGEIDEDELMKMILRGYIVGTGDKYADYYTADEMKEFMSDLDGDVTGIGVSVIYDPDDGAMEIVSVIPDSPAERYGLLVGDLIVGVGIGDEAESVASLGYELSVTKIKGKIGTYAEFVIYRDGEYIDCSIIREKITEQTVLSRVYSLDESVGVIKITSFDKKTFGQFEAAVEELKGLGCTSLVVDLRNNPGGELGAICDVLDYLLPEGPIIRTVDKAGNEEVVATSDAEYLGMPMSIIVNGNTASAAELFTSAMKDYKLAAVVGTKTYGKGCMQTIGYFPDGSGYKFTYRLYNPPFSDNYDGIGIEPDVTVELNPELSKVNPFKYTDEQDNQLAAAVAALNK